MAYRIINWLKWAGIALWLFTLFVAANITYYVYVHEPGVRANIVKVAELKTDNWMLNDDIADLNQKIKDLEDIILDYSLIHGINLEGSDRQDPKGYEPKPH
jgi:hypothetical protein|tara:strand:+ start:709 stop:1011 length:303 start_codon:yes stop_codon:yes gene_type:complete